ncbi:unnamed protein product [Meloidogyne enterolobii]|uniref:Uncharacterized protein n=1 Tax=Meloidogyne enterolobii TaxID=390850 RepID=A0ACB1AL15_MELEN
MVPIRGLKLKIQAAKSIGMKTILLPMQMKTQFEQLSDAEKMGIDGIFGEYFHDIFDKVFPPASTVLTNQTILPILADQLILPTQPALPPQPILAEQAFCFSPLTSTNQQCWYDQNPLACS